MKLKKKIQKTVRLFLLRLSKSRDLAAARNVSIDDVRTVCLFLGPYRNLTTLTASILFLHPNCQVLNHAANRIFHDRRTDFFDGYVTRSSTPLCGTRSTRRGGGAWDDRRVDHAFARFR